MMTRRTTTAMLGFVMVATMTTFGASVHLKGGANAKPNFVDKGLTLNTAASLAGLGNEDLLVTLSATAAATSTCTNQGGNQAPGQNPAEVTVSGSQSIPASEIKNGNVAFGCHNRSSGHAHSWRAGLPQSELEAGHHRPLVYYRHDHGGTAGRYDRPHRQLHLQ